MSHDFPTHCYPLDWIILSPDKSYFIEETSGQAFTPLGFNYDHDEYFRLIEDYWHDEWDKVKKDLTDMRNYGANVIRIHLQLEKFLPEPGKPSLAELQKLDDLLAFASSIGVYLDLVGLCCYHPWEVPDWYNDASCEDRWKTQQFFWDVIARRYVNEPGIFCYDLMNEPVVPGRQREPRGWLGKEFAGKTYIQFITLDGTRTAREEIALRWLAGLSATVRRHDQKRLITVGLVDWSLPSSPMQSGFYPEQIIQHVDFISAHLYPEFGAPEEMIKTLHGFCVGRPVIIDETFHLKCSVPEQEWFLQLASSLAEGFFSFYGDMLPEELDPCDRNRTMRNALSVFRKCAPLFVKKHR